MKKSKQPSPNTCNVLEITSEVRHLWNFGVRNGQVSLAAQRKIDPQEPLPAKIVAKDWSTIFQRKLNIAWLPQDQVFLRVVQLPAADPQELLSMVELQLEKLSPLPVAQIVWSIELLPRSKDNLQPVIVVIAARDVVESYLGVLESAGYLADRLEIPCLHQLLGAPLDQNGVWIFPILQADSPLCLVAWSSNSLLQQLQLLHLPEGAGGVDLVIEQLTKTAWAGEIEGWLASPFSCHLVADLAIASEWERALRLWTDRPVTVTEPLSVDKLSEFGAGRACRDESRVNLLPPEYAARYQQQLVDRVWMGGLGAVLVAYILGVIFYFGALQIANFRYNSLENKIASISNDYTNAIRLKERIDVLQNQLYLKYAALDSLRAVSEKLPTDLTLVSFQFQKGQKLLLSGTAPSDQSTQITDYNEDLRKMKVDGQKLFSKVGPPTWQSRAAVGGGQTLNWSFTCDLNRREAE